MPPLTLLSSSRRHSRAIFKASSNDFKGRLDVPSAVSLPFIGETYISPAKVYMQQKIKVILKKRNLFIKSLLDLYLCKYKNFYIKTL